MNRVTSIQIKVNNVNKMNSDNRKTDNDAGKDIDRRPWVKPDFQKEPLKEALTDNHVSAFHDGNASCAS